MDTENRRLRAQLEQEWVELRHLQHAAAVATTELHRMQEMNQELLTALRTAEFAMDNCPLVSQELNAAIKMARAAIAKAEGA